MTEFKRSLKAALATLESIAALEALVAEAAGIIRETLLGGGKLMLCGNGGSATDAAHIATEFTCRFVNDRRPYPAMALTVDGGLLTAISNDYDFQEVFARQIRAFARPGDALIALSTSGRSRNILTAIEEARRCEMRTIALLGKSGGFTKGAADVELVVEGTETARIQEAQKFLLHVLCELVEPHLAKE
jgi:phosphoheptose isomerase